MFGDFKKLWELQQKAKKLQKELSRAKFEETAYNGNVRVVVSGTGELLEVKINPDALKDIKSVENAIVNAVNSAIKKDFGISKGKDQRIFRRSFPQNIERSLKSSYEAPKPYIKLRKL